MKNKKGFTLVELLAVIVILALIMGIAVVSIGGVLDSAKRSTFKETAASIIDGVKKELLIYNEFEEGSYIFTKAILEKGGTDAPMGGTLQFATTLETGTGKNYAGGKLIGSHICRLSAAKADSACTIGVTESYVTVYKTGDIREVKICLTAGSPNPYIKNGVEADLLKSDNNDMIATS